MTLMKKNNLIIPKILSYQLPKDILFKLVSKEKNQRIKVKIKSLEQEKYQGTQQFLA